jgi:glucose/arabinose dehydrogenase
MREPGGAVGLRMACWALSAALCSSPLAVRALQFADPGFRAERVATFGEFTAVGLAFAPDERMFVWEKSGVVRIVTDAGVLPAPFLDLSARVNAYDGRGLLGLAIDPAFADNGFVYLLYVYDPPGIADPDAGTPRTSRLTRVTASAADPDLADPTSEVVLLGTVGEAPCSAAPAGADCIGADHFSHAIGTVRFAPDGMLFVGSGDGASFTFADPLALRAQSLDSLNGKLLRIRPDGGAPPDNPYFDGTSSNRSKVWAYGLRNPFRFALDPQVGEPWIGDVGWNQWEELDRGRGANFGWPCFEGAAAQPDYQAAFPLCAALDPATLTAPAYVYPHSEDGPGGSVVVGAFATGAAYPAVYRGNLLFADYADDWIRRARLDGEGNLVEVLPFATGARGPVAIESGPDGRLYLVSFGAGEVQRILFAGPEAVASAAPSAGYSPLAVQLSSAGSSDPEDPTLDYVWDFGDGGSSTAAHPMHLYTAALPTSFTARLTVINDRAESSAATVRIVVGSLPPAVAIDDPDGSHPIHPGQTLHFAGSASDPDEPPGALELRWRVLLRHDVHLHSLAEITGPSGSLVAPEAGEAGSFALELRLTATDGSGLATTAALELPLLPALFVDDFESGGLTRWTVAP